MKDPRISPEIKEKIRLIEKYKVFFYQFWKERPKKIYSKTTILEGKAVTHLVVASKFYEIRAKKECFPFMGCFPYLGHFSKDRAVQYAQKLHAKNFETWIRPVYAYSTLGYFTDPILSSFFSYDKYELAELIFHELFHTIFFIKNEVDLNENMANYFAKKMTQIYFSQNDQIYRGKLDLRKKMSSLKVFLASLIKNLNQKYQGVKSKEKTTFVQIRNEYLKVSFIPKIRAKCVELQIPEKSCFPLKRKWNNASFAAYLTYEKNMERIKILHDKLKIDLKSFLDFIKKKYDSFLDDSIDGPFEEFLLKNSHEITKK